MAHVRQSIRENIKAALVNLPDIISTNVFSSRFFPMAEDKLPAICIYSKSEDSEYSTITVPRSVLHQCEFSVEIYVKGTYKAEDTVDEISAEIAEALSTDLTRGGLAKDTRVEGFNFDFNADGDQPVAVATLTVVVDYDTLENDLTDESVVYITDEAGNVLLTEKSVVLEE